ncbi:hypothetical protein LEP1GSC013_4303 [Leptospira interrogans serovar Valbuzzi str. Duyster]|nr:hypothetical protein LEP1GSC013_4303 [Leptospira interrogans serovar Valbuzzi str. Duyster]ENO70161.1 hypothetical protein LEP1GSC012_4010 [Leptospira interrogans serovar Valbuzzi str. Valbuzzi]
MELEIWFRKPIGVNILQTLCNIFIFFFLINMFDRVDFYTIFVFSKSYKRFSLRKLELNDL